MNRVVKSAAKGAAAGALAMAAIIAVQLGLTYTFDFQVGEMFGKTAARIIFWYFLCRCLVKRRQPRFEAEKTALSL